MSIVILTSPINISWNLPMRGLDEQHIRSTIRQEVVDIYLHLAVLVKPNIFKVFHVWSVAVDGFWQSEQGTTFLAVEKHLAHERESRCCPDPQVAHAQREMAIPCNYTKNNTGFCLKFAQTDLTIAKNLLDIGQLLKILVNSRQQWFLGFNPWVWDCCVVFCRAKKTKQTCSPGSLEPWNLLLGCKAVNGASCIVTIPDLLGNPLQSSTNHQLSMISSAFFFLMVKTL